jgi:hypothetical protein
MTRRSNRRRAEADPDEADPDETPDRLALFRERLASGEYDAVIGEGLRRTLHDAAQDTTLEAEIGALRVALARLLHDEDNPIRLASGIARVAGVAVQAARLRGSASTEVAEIRNAILGQLELIDREHARNARQDKETDHDDPERGGHVPSPRSHRPDGSKGADQPRAGDGL